jgi:hypothetical protein
MNGDEVSFEARPRRRWRGLILTLVVLGAFAIGIAFALWGLEPVRERLSPRSAPLPAVTAPPVTAEPEPGADLTSLYAREITLASRLEILENRLAGIEGDSRIASSHATRAEGVLVAFAARRALDRGLPLGYVEGQLRERFGALRPNAVAAVIDAAEHPVTLEDLRMGLDSMAPELMSGTRDGWLPALRRELSGLVVLRADTTPSARPADRLARARRLIDAGKLEAAMAEVSRMPGASNGAAWLAAAQRYVTARRALDVVEATALSLPDRPPQPPQPPEPAPQPNANP